MVCDGCQMVVTDCQTVLQRRNGPLVCLVHDLEVVFFNDRVGQDVFGDFLELFLRFVSRPAIQIQNKEFSLPHVGNRGIAKSGKCVLNRLSLRIEHGAFRHHPHMSFHRVIIARHGKRALATDISDASPGRRIGSKQGEP